MDRSGAPLADGHRPGWCRRGWRRWSRLARRLLVEGLVAVGSYAGGLAAPPVLPQRWLSGAEETQRALWIQLPEVHRLLPLLEGLPEPDGRGDLTDGRR